MSPGPTSSPADALSEALIGVTIWGPLSNRRLRDKGGKPANLFFDPFWAAFLGNFGTATIVHELGVFDKEHSLTATHTGRD